MCSWPSDLCVSVRKKEGLITNAAVHATVTEFHKVFRSRMQQSPYTCFAILYYSTKHVHYTYRYNIAWLVGDFV